jgi:hypothetical protein
MGPARYTSCAMLLYNYPLLRVYLSSLAPPRPTVKTRHAHASFHLMSFRAFLPRRPFLPCSRSVTLKAAFAHCRRLYATEVSLSNVSKPSSFGQPTSQSHPHLGPFERQVVQLQTFNDNSSLVKLGEVTPGIPAHEYERRRAKLMESLPKGALVVSFAAPVKYMSDGTFYNLFPSALLN